MNYYEFDGGNNLVKRRNLVRNGMEMGTKF